MISVIYFQHLEHLVIPCYTNYVSKVIANPDTKAHKKSFCHLCQSQACYEKLIYLSFFFFFWGDRSLAGYLSSHYKMQLTGNGCLDSANNSSEALYLSLYPVFSQSLRQGGEAWVLLTVFMYSSSSLVKRFANSFSYSARVSSGVAILNIRQLNEKNPQITRKLQTINRLNENGQPRVSSVATKLLIFCLAWLQRLTLSTSHGIFADSDAALGFVFSACYFFLRQLLAPMRT